MPDLLGRTNAYADGWEAPRYSSFSSRTLCVGSRLATPERGTVYPTRPSALGGDARPVRPRRKGPGMPRPNRRLSQGASRMKMRAQETSASDGAIPGEPSPEPALGPCAPGPAHWLGDRTGRVRVRDALPGGRLFPTRAAAPLPVPLDLDATDGGTGRGGAARERPGRGKPSRPPKSGQTRRTAGRRPPRTAPAPRTTRSSS
jgi:hypothetical protein